MQLGKSQVLDDASYEELDEGWESSDRIAAHRVALVRAYFTRLGLRGPASEAAAHRVVNEVVRTLGDWNDPNVDRRLVAVAREWIRNFSEDCAFVAVPSESVDHPVHNWYSRTPALLAKFPSAFLETPVPSPSH